MDYSDASCAYQSIRASSQKPQVDGLLGAAVRYAHFRAEWALSAPEQRLEMDQRRTSAHDAFIDACNILSRAMIKAGEDASWRRQLGSDRRVIGDFACHLHCLLGLQAR